MKKIILASSSPRRKELLERIGLSFAVKPSKYDENKIVESNPHKLAQLFSLEKAKIVSQKHKHAIVIGADSIVVCKGKILGKPHTPQAARDMLKTLSGTWHLVITGFAIIDTDTKKKIVKSIETKVWMRNIPKKEIDAYVRTGEPLDKAGAYAVQEKGGVFVRKIEGDYFNVVGLPIFSLVEELKKFDVYVF